MEALACPLPPVVICSTMYVTSQLSLYTGQSDHIQHQAATLFQVSCVTPRAVPIDQPPMRSTGCSNRFYQNL